MAATFESKIEAMIGNTSAEASFIQDALAASMLEVMKSLPSDLTIPLCSNIVNLSAASTQISVKDNAVVLAVYYADNGLEAREVSNAMFNKLSDSTSIHEASQLDPVFTIKNNASGLALMHVYPAPSNGEMFVFQDPTSINLSHDFTTGSYADIPLVAQELVMILTGLKVLQIELGNAKASEDPELIQMVTALINALQAQYQIEASKLFGAPKEK